MTFIQPSLSTRLWVPGTAILLYSLYRAVRFFSAMRQHSAVRALQAYFNDTVCPRTELAPHLQELPLSRGPQQTGKTSGTETSWLWAQKEAAEMNSPYYLRTGQQVSALVSISPTGIWYGPEAWIRDILASRDDTLRLTGAEPEKKT